MKGFLRLSGLIAALFVFALLADQIAPLKQFDSYLKEHPQPWTGLTVGATFAGFGLLVFAWISWGILTGRPMSEAEAQEFVRTGPVRPGSAASSAARRLGSRPRKGMPRSAKSKMPSAPARGFAIRPCGSSASVPLGCCSWCWVALATLS